MNGASAAALTCTAQPAGNYGYCKPAQVRTLTILTFFLFMRDGL